MFTRAAEMLAWWGRHEVRFESPARAASGVEADWWPGLTIIDYLVVLGQMTQALVYSSAGLSRADAGALWMRTMQIERLRPPAEASAFESEARILRDRVFERTGQRLHDVEVVATTTTDVRARSTLAYAEASR